MLSLEVARSAGNTARRSVLALVAAVALAACGSSTHQEGSSGRGSNAGNAGVAGEGVSGRSNVGGAGLSGGGSSGQGGADNGGKASAGLGGGGAAGAAGLGGDGAAGAEGPRGGAGSGGVPYGACPARPPANNATCAPGLLSSACTYDDCEGSGKRTVASCTSHMQDVGNLLQLWSVETFPCGEQAPCAGDAAGQSCPVGRVCLVLESGAVVTQCAEHSCGSGAIECDCVEGCFTGCTKSSAREAITFTCNTCSDPRGCP